MGRVYMPTIDCPFQTAKRELSRLKRETSAIIVDIHAEATSEKMAMGHFLTGSGRCDRYAYACADGR